MRHKIKKLKGNNKKIFESSLTINKNKDLRLLRREPLFVLKVKKKTCGTSYVTTLTPKRK